MQSITEREMNFYRATQNITQKAYTVYATQKAYTVYASRELRAQATFHLRGSGLTSA